MVRIFLLIDVCLESFNAQNATNIGKVPIPGRTIDSSVNLVKRMQNLISLTYLSFKENQGTWRNHTSKIFVRSVKGLATIADQDLPILD